MGDAMLGILGAMKPEVKAIRAALDDPRVEQRLGYDITVGTLDGREIAVIQCGVGKVNAGLATAALSLTGVDRMVFVGVAGGIAHGVGIGDLVIADDLVQHDVDVTSMGQEPGKLLGEPVAWVTDADLTDALAAAASTLGVTVHRGRIASGDQFVADAALSERINTTFGALAVEMEGAAVAQAATRIGVPVAVARWISDSADSGAVDDFPAFLQHAAELDLAIVRALVAHSASDSH